jgi:hypothetical protein
MTDGVSAADNQDKGPTIEEGNDSSSEEFDAASDGASEEVAAQEASGDDEAESADSSDDASESATVSKTVENYTADIPEGFTEERRASSDDDGDDSTVKEDIYAVATIQPGDSTWGLAGQLGLNSLDSVEVLDRDTGEARENLGLIQPGDTFRAHVGTAVTTTTAIEPEAEAERNVDVNLIRTIQQAREEEAAAQADAAETTQPVAPVVEASTAQVGTLTPVNTALDQEAAVAAQQDALAQQQQINLARQAELDFMMDEYEASVAADDALLAVNASAASFADDVGYAADLAAASPDAVDGTLNLPEKVFVGTNIPYSSNSPRYLQSGGHDLYQPVVAAESNHDQMAAAEARVNIENDKAEAEALAVAQNRAANDDLLLDAESAQAIYGSKKIDELTADAILLDAEKAQSLTAFTQSPLIPGTDAYAETYTATGDITNPIREITAYDRAQASGWIPSDEVAADEAASPTRTVLLETGDPYAPVRAATADEIYQGAGQSKVAEVSGGHALYEPVRAAQTHDLTSGAHALYEPVRFNTGNYEEPAQLVARTGANRNGHVETEDNRNGRVNAEPRYNGSEHELEAGAPNDYEAAYLQGWLSDDTSVSAVNLTNPDTSTVDAVAAQQAGERRLAAAEAEFYANNPAQETFIGPALGSSDSSYEAKLRASGQYTETEIAYLVENQNILIPSEYSYQDEIRFQENDDLEQVMIDGRLVDNPHYIGPHENVNWPAINASQAEQAAQRAAAAASAANTATGDDVGPQPVAAPAANTYAPPATPMAVSGNTADTQVINDAAQSNISVVGYDWSSGTLIGEPASNN